MILVRAPLRISFAGGGTDLPAFYRRSPGRVLSATIDKYVYLAINRTPLIDAVTARYSISETVAHPSELQHTRIRAALSDLGVERNIEIGSFASLPAKTGLGSSSSFSVALLKGLHAFRGQTIGSRALAEAACRLEIELVGEPIGKQDQYAAAHGGFNLFQFNPDETVGVEPILLDYKKRALLEDHALLLFTGITRSAAAILGPQQGNAEEKFETYRAMARSVDAFKEMLLAGDIGGMASVLHDGWLKKKSLAAGISNSAIDAMYEAGIAAGALGGKVLGAGGGGCLLFLAPPEAHERIEAAARAAAPAELRSAFRRIPFRFTQSGTDILYNNNNLHPALV